jgi:osmotically inducible lipoprotein OsmB
METIRMHKVAAVAAAVVIVLSGCSAVGTKDKDTAIGVGAGGASGPIPGVGAVGTAAGAVAGGIVGHEIGKPKEPPPEN